MKYERTTAVETYCDKCGCELASVAIWINGKQYCIECQKRVYSNNPVEKEK